MAITVRPLGDEDAEASLRLGLEAFGEPTNPPTQTAVELLHRPGRTFFGAFDGGRLAARMAWRDYDSWFGGRLVRTAGIASVTVAAEDRGRGLLTPLFDETLSTARAAGATISTLFPSAAGIYRRFGYELIGDYLTVSLPTWALARAGSTTEVRTRRATAADGPAIRGVYDTWAAAQNGPLSRRGRSFPADDEGLIADFTGVTVAVDGDDTVVGYASWSRGHGYGSDAALGVSDLLALSVDGYRALLASVGTFGSVTPTTKIDTSGADPVRLLLPTSGWEVTSSDPYMLLVLDVPGALAGRDYPPGLTADLTFTVAGHPLPGVAGTYVLAVADRGASCEPTSRAADRVLTTRGLALLYAGVQTCANLRFAGLLTGGDPAEDPIWDGLFAGRPVHIRDYF